MDTMSAFKEVVLPFGPALFDQPALSYWPALCVPSVWG